MIFEENVLQEKTRFEVQFLIKCLDDSAWLCVEKLKNTFLRQEGLTFTKLFNKSEKKRKSRA